MAEELVGIVDCAIAPGITTAMGMKTMNVNIDVGKTNESQFFGNTGF